MSDNGNLTSRSRRGAHVYMHVCILKQNIALCMLFVSSFERRKGDNGHFSKITQRDCNPIHSD